MNAVTRTMDEQRLLLSLGQFARPNLAMMLMVVLLLVSAFSIVYAKDLGRRLFIQYQDQQQQKENAIIEWNKLLLEQGAWSAQLRIQKMAGEELGMVVPQAGDIVLIAEDS
jgi:cell division protein FtsL